MELTIDHAKLKGRRLFIATPMYGGQCHADYTYAIARLSAMCSKLDINLRFHFMCNESLIMRARNLSADTFMKSDNTHLLFIDADMGFDPNDVIYMLAMQDDDPTVDDHDVVTGPYPLKSFDWSAIARAAKSGVADKDPRLLEKYASRIIITPIGEGRVPLNQPTPVALAGTGFMMIRRATFDRFRTAWPDLAFKNDPRLVAAGQEADLFAYFETAIDNKAANLAEELKLFLAARPDATHADITAFLDDPEASMKSYSGLFTSEDYMFCRRVREAGMKVWSCPWMQLTHTGNYTFTSSLAHIAKL